MKNQYPPVLIAAQYGGKDADQAVDPLVRQLRTIEKRRPKEYYGPVIQTLSFIFRVDGQFVQWNFSGTQAQELSAKEHHVTVDIGIPTKLWKGVPQVELRTYIANTLVVGAKELGDLAKELRHEFDAARAISDVTELGKDFIASSL